MCEPSSLIYKFQGQVHKYHRGYGEWGSGGMDRSLRGQIAGAVLGPGNPQGEPGGRRGGSPTGVGEECRRSHSIPGGEPEYDPRLLSSLRLRYQFFDLTVKKSMAAPVLSATIMHTAHSRMPTKRSHGCFVARLGLQGVHTQVRTVQEDQT